MPTALSFTSRQSLGSAWLWKSQRNRWIGVPTSSNAVCADSRSTFTNSWSPRAEVGMAFSVWSHPPPAVSGGVEVQHTQHAIGQPVPAVFHPLEVGPHVLGAPGAVARELGDVVPVGVVRIDGDHCVAGGAAPAGAGAGIEHAVDGLPVPVLGVLGVAFLSLVAAVVSNEEVPLHRLV